jgi:hypothetical protein
LREIFRAVAFGNQTTQATQGTETLTATPLIEESI